MVHLVSPNFSTDSYPPDVGAEHEFIMHPRILAFSLMQGATSYMHWIAAQYKTEMPRGYQLPTSCSQSRGRKDDIEKSSEN